LCIFSISPQSIFSQTFTEVSRDIGIEAIHTDMLFTGGGCAFFDYNNDGFEDIFLTGGRNEETLFRNNGDGTFSNVTEAAGIIKNDTIASNSISIGDINNDGCKDIFIGTTIKDILLSSHTPNLLFINNCDGTFTDITESAGLLGDRSYGMGATMGDVNQDGWLDIYVVNYIEQGLLDEDEEGNLFFAHTPQDNYLYINNGDNTFTESAALYGVGDYGCTLASAFTDYDQDGDVDLFVSNDFGYDIEPSSLYKNDFPNPSFSDVGDESGINSPIYGMGIAIGDYDEDGDFDYYEANFGRNILHQNQGDGTFLDKATESGTENTWITFNSTTTISWGTFFGDFTNNTYLDLFVSNGFLNAGPPAPLPDLQNYNAYFQNNQDGTFTNVANLLGINSPWSGRGGAFGDYDNDGDLDFLAVVIDEFAFAYDTIDNPLRSLVYRNDTDNDNNWIAFQVQGTDIIRDAYGTRVELYTDGRKLIREVDGGSSHASHNSSRIHFGLGNITEIDSIKFVWQGAAAEIYTDLTMNEYHLIIQGEGIPVANSELNTDFKFNVFPTIFNNEIHVSLELAKNKTTTFYIYDNKGALIQNLGKQELLQGKNNINFNQLNHLPAGIYYLKINIDGKVMAKKIVKN
ncbi:MAG: hypothetical protein ACI94Y_004583, partial [Maribacter sp.]